jgi:hypothetical protein
MEAPLRVVAIIAAYNEEDIIGQVVGNLVQQGVLVYLLDHGSTDRTVTEVEPFLGRGLIGVERFPGEGSGPGDPAPFPWTAILRRKEVLGEVLDARWVIHHDADEFREGPWSDVSLVDAIQRVDVLGYNAIDFELLNFWPTHDRFRIGDDPRQAFGFYEPGPAWDRVQIKCWKKTGARVDLVSSGGHEARFPGRRVFPLRFLLRHYPVRGQAHGERKVFRERVPRFDPEERKRGWHVQYEGLREGHRFIRDAAELTPYDPVSIRLLLALRHRGVEELEEAVSASRRDVDELGKRVEGCERRIAGLELELAAAEREQRARERELADVLASRSWRWTAPLRATLRLLGGR